MRSLVDFVTESITESKKVELETIKTLDQAREIIYKNTPKDYKSNNMVMVNRGSTVLVPLEKLTTTEIAYKLQSNVTIGNEFDALRKIIKYLETLK